MKKNPWIGWTKRVFKISSIAWCDGEHARGVFLFRMDRYGAPRVHGFISDTLGLDGVE